MRLLTIILRKYLTQHVFATEST